MIKNAGKLISFTILQFVRLQIFFFNFRLLSNFLLLKRYDFLILRYIDSNGEKTSTSRMCGDAMIPRRAIDSYGPIILEFISDSSNRHKGFNLYFDLGEYKGSITNHCYSIFL